MDRRVVTPLKGLAPRGACVLIAMAIPGGVRSFSMGLGTPIIVGVSGHGKMRVVIRSSCPMGCGMCSILGTGGRGTNRWSVLTLAEGGKRTLMVGGGVRVAMLRVQKSRVGLKVATPGSIPMCHGRICLRVRGRGRRTVDLSNVRTLGKVLKWDKGAVKKYWIFASALQWLFVR